MDRSPPKMEARIAKLLIVGVTLAGMLVALGGAVYLLRHGGEQPHYQIFRGEPSDLRTMRGVLGEAMHLSGRGIVQIGLVLLVAVQLARVALTAWLFAVQRDRIFLGISLGILALLAYSLLGNG